MWGPMSLSARMPSITSVRSVARSHQQEKAFGGVGLGGVVAGVVDGNSDKAGAGEGGAEPRELLCRASRTVGQDNERELRERGRELRMRLGGAGFKQRSVGRDR